MRLNRSLHGARDCGVMLLVALVLSVSALWNGQPFFYPDTPTYLRGAEMGAARLLGSTAFKPWLPALEEPKASDPSASPADESARQLKPLTSIEDKVVLAGRSVYYGALLYAGYLSGKMWLAVAVQALCVAYVLQLLMMKLWGLRSRELIGVAAALSLLTPLGVYTGFLMPDVFAPLVILSMGTLAVYWGQLSRPHRWVLSALLLFGLCAHSSHLALAVLLLALVLAARFFSTRWRGLPWAGLAVVACCIVGALAAEWAFNKAVTVAVGAPPLRLPHLMGRLINLGPGTAYLRQHCPGSGYAACAYLRNYPTQWDDFLFSTNPAKGTFALADAATKRRLSDEQLHFSADVIRFDPVGVMAGVGVDVLRQLVDFRVDIAAYDKHAFGMYEGRVPDGVLADMHNSRAARLFSLNHWLTISSYAMVLASLLMSGLWHLLRSNATALALAVPRQRSFADFAWLVVAGVVANAVVCATLASSMDRFQARVIWLLPFMALAVLAGASARRVSPAKAATGTNGMSISSARSSLQGGAP
ncbi:hypothetical protein BH10PSE16_BH10PSE16_31030 [soil metagenome]